MNKNILTSLGPNYEKDDVRLALKLIFSPERWRDSFATKKLESNFVRLFGDEFNTLSVNSGRSGLYLILRALGISEKDEVLLQSFTCIAVPNSIMWNSAKPVYVDVGDDFNIDPNDLERKITEKSKVVIVQHTFGIPADLQKIQDICKKYNLILIEDCAHSLGATYDDKPLGTFGRASFFSFGRDKTISSVFGGMILTKDKNLYKKLKNMQDNLSYPANYWIIQQLLHPIAMSIIKPTYNIGFGKVTFGKLILYIFQKLKLLSFPVYESEKRGNKPYVFPAKMPGALALLADNQLQKLGRYVEHRKDISRIYRENLRNTGFKLHKKRKGEVLLRFPVISKEAKMLYEKFKKEGVLLGNWYNNPVVPGSIDGAGNYMKESCTNSEKYSEEILNLPTYIGITEKDAREISRLLKVWVK